MIVAGNLVRQRQISRVEDARLGAEQLQQPRRLLDAEAREGPVA